MAKKIAKLNITTGFGDWWKSDMSDIFIDETKVQVISAIEYNGGLYLIYTYDEDDFIENKKASQ